MDGERDDDLTGEEILGWAEFCCWSALAMAPLIYWIQGPSVSNDQHVVRIALVVIAAVGAANLRVRSILRNRRSRSNQKRSKESHERSTETSLVRPELAWVHVQSAAVEVDGRLERVRVSEA